MRKRARSVYPLLAAAIVLLGALAELLRIVLNAPWPGFGPWPSHVASALLALLFVGTAVELLRGEEAALGERVLGVAAPLVMVAHALVTRVGGSRLGLLYVPLAILFALCAFRAFRAEPRDRRGQPTTDVIDGGELHVP